LFICSNWALLKLCARLPELGSTNMRPVRVWDKFPDVTPGQHNGRALMIVMFYF
jgi:hypothetical protein